MPLTDFEQLSAAAFKSERVAARRLVARTQLSETQALQQVLTQAAGLAGLPALLDARAALLQREQQRRTARTAEQQRRRAARNARNSLPSDGWRAWFDGSAHPNPGQIGIGALLCGPAGERIEISRRAGYGNSSEAEYLALIALLEAALEVGAAGLVVAGDSQVVVNDASLSAQALAAGQGARSLASHRQRVTELMQQLAALGTVSLRWLPRHRNSEADHLSQQALRQVTSEPCDPL